MLYRNVFDVEQRCLAALLKENKPLNSDCSARCKIQYCDIESSAQLSSPAVG